MSKVAEKVLINQPPTPGAWLIYHQKIKGKEKENNREVGG